MALEIDHREREGIEVLALKGRLVIGEEDTLLRSEIEKVIAAGKTRLVVDLEKTTDLDAAGLGTLLYAQAELEKAGGTMVLANLQPAHIALMVLSRMERSFEIFQSDQDAVNSFFPDRRIPPFDLLELVEFMRRSESTP